MQDRMKSAMGALAAGVVVSLCLSLFAGGMSGHVGDGWGWTAISPGPLPTLPPWPPGETPSTEQADGSDRSGTETPPSMVSFDSGTVTTADGAPDSPSSPARVAPEDPSARSSSVPVPDEVAATATSDRGGHGSDDGHQWDGRPGHKDSDNKDSDNHAKTKKDPGKSGGGEPKKGSENHKGPKKGKGKPEGSQKSPKVKAEH